MTNKQKKIKREKIKLKNINVAISQVTRDRLIAICSHYDNHVTISQLVDIFLNESLDIMELEIQNRNKQEN